jgi:hypothetical protein
MEAETPALLSPLGDQRRHVLGILEGPPDGMLHRAVLPSGWTCVAMVRHLALHIERFWFREVVAGELFGPAIPPERRSGLGRPHRRACRGRLRALPTRDRPYERDHHVDSYRGPAHRLADDLWPSWRLHELRETVPYAITDTVPRRPP